MSKKKKFIIAGVVAAVVIIAAVCLGFFLHSGSGTSSESQVYVSPVSEITGQGNAGLFNRYTGVVQPQETLEIEVDPNKTIKEIFVSEGDNVETGTELFAYDTDEINLSLSQAQLDLEGFANEITSINAQIADLEKERQKAPADAQLEYTTQIQEKQNDLRRAEYNQKSKQVEIEQIKKSLDTAVVTSEITGIVQSINQNGEYDNMTGEPLPFMTVLATGNYRIMGKINETNAAAINEGGAVIIRSRVDEDQIWTGVISMIDFENPIANENSYIYDSSGGGEQSSSYPFYVELDSASGLMLGQHVFIELDNGQMVDKDGLWLMENYIIIDGPDTYVWAMDGRDRLEKRKIELGEYDSQMMEYQIVSGLAEDDNIAWPTSILEEGMPCTVSSVDEMMQQNMEAEMMQQMESGQDGTDIGVDPGMVDDMGIDPGAAGGSAEGDVEGGAAGDNVRDGAADGAADADAAVTE